MSEIHVQQIKANLKNEFNNLLDLQDVATASEQQREQTFVTRALAAFVPLHFYDLDPSEAAKCVTDGSGDNGIDAVYFSGSEKILTVVQSKWADDGRGSIEVGELHKFIAGFKDLINLRLDRFSLKFKS